MHREAIADLTRLIALDSGNDGAYVSRARSYIETGDFDKALVDADRALSIIRRSPDALVERGRAREGKGDLKAAIADYRLALEVQPDHAAARRNLTRVGEN